MLSPDPRLVGIAAGGSFITDDMDELSDLDLVIVAAPDRYASVLDERKTLAATLGPLLAAFTGEHVGEPRLLVCLYDDTEPLHVDLKFVSTTDVAQRVEDPVVLWERDGALSRALAEGTAAYPQPDPQWLEDRFWVWVHYIAAKIARGELFEAHGSLGQVRALVLGPLALVKSGARPSGVRRLERLPAADVALLRETVGGLSPAECLRALHGTVAAYRALRPVNETLVLRAEAERAALEYLERITGSPP